MKKLLFLILTVISLNLSATSKTEGLEKVINSKFSFFMTREQLEKSIQKKSVMENNGIVYYENLPDPIGNEQKLVSFMFDDRGIISSVYSRETTEKEHKKILDQYRAYFKNVPESKLKKLENMDSGIILYYNTDNNILLQVMYMNGQTLITEQIYTQEVLDYRINLVKNGTFLK